MDPRTITLQSHASNLTTTIHVLAITTFVLLLVWLLHYREGVNYYSDDGSRVFNAHPLLMVLGLLCSGEALIAFKILTVERQTRKTLHMLLNLTAFVLGAIGVRAVFKFHNMQSIKNMYSFHSWIGISTITLFGLQWLIGFFTFMAGGAPESAKRKVKPWHICCGRAIFFMAICTALTGLMEKATFLSLTLPMHQTYVVNFLGLSILLFGIFVDISISISRSG